MTLTGSLSLLMSDARLPGFTLCPLLRSRSPLAPFIVAYYAGACGGRADAELTLISPFEPACLRCLSFSKAKFLTNCFLFKSTVPSLQMDEFWSVLAVASVSPSTRRASGFGFDPFLSLLKLSSIASIWPIR